MDYLPDQQKRKLGQLRYYCEQRGWDFEELEELGL